MEHFVPHVELKATGQLVLVVRHALNKYTVSKKLLAMSMVIVILAGTVGFLVYQNFSLGQANSELLKTNDELSKSNDELSTQLQNVAHELDVIKHNYTRKLLWS